MKQDHLFVLFNGFACLNLFYVFQNDMALIIKFDFSSIHITCLTTTVSFTFHRQHICNTDNREHIYPCSKAWDRAPINRIHSLTAFYY